MPRVTRAAIPFVAAIAVVALGVGLLMVDRPGLNSSASTSAPTGVAPSQPVAAASASPAPLTTGIISAPLSQLAAGAAHADEVGGLDDEGEGEGEEEPELPPLPGPHGVDTAVQHTPGALGPSAPLTPVPAPTTSWAGLGAGFSGPGGTMAVTMIPADTSIGIGLDQVVETVNFRLAVFNKGTGAVVSGPVSPKTLFTGFGGLCETAEDGDAVVLYDRAADRWVVTWFAGYGVSNGTTIPYLECVAVSTTANANGAWARYAFGYTMLNDYPKLSVWGDSYVATFNMFDIPNGSAYMGPKACAYDRAAMLAGTAARAQQCFDLPSMPGGGQYAPILAATVDSFDQPPAGAPVPLIGLADTTHLGAWNMAVDWVTPASSSLSGPSLITVPTVNDACSGAPAGSSCVPQPGTSRTLASMAGRVMQRLAYRSDAGVERMALTHSVGGATSSQVRWYELGISAGRGVSVVNKGTYAPDASYRWMGSAARDWAGDFAVGYNVSSGSVFPSLAVAGRLPGDAVDTLGQAEQIAYAGSGSQTGYDRWGDYTTMALDPANDCTFWFAGQYLPATHSYNWRTRIVSFAFPSCTPSRLVTLSIAGNAPGSVTSDVAGMNCAASCRQVWANGTTVTLTPHPAPGSTFDGWSGACSGTSTCSIALSAAATVGALFNDHTPPEVAVNRPAATTNASTLTFGLAFSESVQSVEQADLDWSGTATGCTIETPAGSAAAWTVDVTGCSEGTVALTVKQATVPDLVGNLGPTAPATSADLLVDRTAPVITSAPVVSLRTGATLPTNSTTAAVPLTVTWAATDPGGVGVAYVVLERSVSGGAWIVVAPAVAGSTAQVTATSSGTINYQATPVDAAGNVGTPVAGVAVSPRLIQQSTSAVKYTSTWFSLTATSVSGKTLKWSRTRYATATLTTTARSVALVVYRGIGRGKAYIYVGSTKVATIELYRSSAQARYVIWSKDWGVSATRVIKVKVLATSGRPRVDLDAFVVLR